MSKPGRNDPCPCGARRKYKRCCWGLPDDLIGSEPPGPIPLHRLEAVKAKTDAMMAEEGYDVAVSARLRRMEVARRLRSRSRPSGRSIARTAMTLAMLAMDNDRHRQ